MRPVAPDPGLPEFCPLARRPWGGVSVPQGDVMGLWLLSFTEREVAMIVEAETLAHARLLAASNQICRASQFDEAWAIKHSIREQIPADFIGRTLSQDETADLLSTLTICARYEALIDENEAVPA
jgi:hypothetical protein